MTDVDEDCSAPAGGGWFVYVLVSTSTTATYVGIARDVARRLEQHNGLAPGGARRTRMGRPWMLAAVAGPFPDRAAAQRAEHALKRRRGQARVGECLLMTGR